MSERKRISDEYCVLDNYVDLKTLAEKINAAIEAEKNGEWSEMHSDVKSEYEDSYNIVIVGKRLETDAEYNRRIKQEERQRNQNKKNKEKQKVEQEKYEKKLYEKLKNKYGDK